ncbi:copper resistance protein CopC [Amycolatopsis sp. NPDC006131]|uniref:copper resistance CopC/CopD family protein n=1 Tax=Amycolatopsis sp. NPDC006131 TaxID=3156731 RepID=UPI0033BAF15A
MTTTATSAPRRLARAAVMLFVAVAALVAGATTASAHPTLLFTDPSPDTAVADAPPTITLVFNEAVTAGDHAVSLSRDDGGSVTVGAPVADQGGRILAARVGQPLNAGTYLVRWQVTGSDGDPVEGEFRFAVGAAISGAAVSSGSATISWTDAALRWLLFAGLAVALGGAVGDRLTGSARAENPALPPVRSWVGFGALAGLTGVVGLGGLFALSAGTATALWQGRVGQLLLVEAAGLALAAGLTRTRLRRWAMVPLVVVTVAEGLRSHANVAAPGWGALLTAVHLLAVTVWAGALVQVARVAVSWRHRRPAVRWVLTGYLRLAVWVFGIVVASGFLSAVVLVPVPTLLTSTYGRVLLVKLALVTVVTGLAIAARLAVRRAERTDGVRVLVRVEASALIVVLAVSAVLVSTPPAGSQQPTPPPARGLVVPVSALAGQIGVSASASAGQLVVRLSTPLRGDYYEAKPPQDYSLSGEVAAAGGAGPIDFRGCGEGCFVSPVQWHDGTNVLTLRAGADEWQGGTVSLLVPWPPQPGAADLARAVEKMRTVDRVTIYETVTSDTTTTTPEPQRLDLAGAWFVAQEPYASGVAPIATRTSAEGRPVRLAISFPAEMTTAVLTLDEEGRISEETLTDDTHLIRRRFVYTG